VIERTGSDNTSTSMSIEKTALPAQRTQQQRPATSNPYATAVLHPVSSTKSWSDDTITAPAPAKLSQIKKQKTASDTWDTSPSDDDTNVSKPKSVLSNLQKTLTFAPATNYRTSSISDDDSIETEIRKLDVQKPTAGSAIEKLVNKQIGTGYKVIGLSDVQSPVNEDSSWTTSPVPDNKESNTKGIHHLVQKQNIDESTWDDSRPLSSDLKQIKPSTNLIVRQANHPEGRPTGIENLTKMMETMMHPHKNQ
jgi:hypothetical protein